MTEQRRLDTDQEAERIIPLDGPYTAGNINDAAALAAELIRHLNHATQMPGALNPNDVDSLISRIERLVVMLPQLVKQTSRMLNGFADDPNLCTDGLTPTYLTEPGVVARLAADLLRDDVTGRLHTAHGLLSLTRTYSARLYLASPPEGKQ